MSKNMKNIALIGAGYWGKNHLRNLENIGVLNCVLETSDKIAQQRKNDFPDVKFITSDKDIIDNPEIEGVVIAAPAELHYKLTKKYLLAV
jgi:UDP-2-acetamido-3-amino-2,3-dideoxy-glucuronate N-acetyltransferase